jgi:hypothetical protein
MMDIARHKLTSWLAGHDANLERFAQLVNLSTVAQETGLAIDAVRKTIATADSCIFHVWSHTHAGRTRPNKPYGLHLGGPESVCLDWEDSVVAAAEAEFQRRGYLTCRELGTDEHIQCLVNDPDLRRLTAGTNLRDLWAQRRDGNQIDFWIIEAKGKEAGGFDRYCFAEALSQVFEIPAEPLSALLGSRRKASHGLCFKVANQLMEGWRKKGFEVKITLAVLVPLWTPDVIWDGAAAKTRPLPYYQRPYDEFVEFIEQESSHASTSTKAAAAFKNILAGLEANYSIRSLSLPDSEIRFRILTTSTNHASGKFILREFPTSCSVPKG